MSLERIIDARLRAHERSERRSAGMQAIMTRNEIIRRELRRGVDPVELARRYQIGITTVEKLGRVSA